MVDLRFYVVPDIQPKVILGYVFLSANIAAVECDPSGMQTTFDPVRNIVTPRRFTVPEKSAMVLLARITGSPLPDQSIGTTTDSPTLSTAGLLPTKSLSTNHNMSCHFECANFTSKPLTVPAGPKLGNSHACPAMILFRVLIVILGLGKPGHPHCFS